MVRDVPSRKMIIWLNLPINREQLSPKPFSNQTPPPLELPGRKPQMIIGVFEYFHSVPAALLQGTLSCSLRFYLNRVPWYFAISVSLYFSSWNKKSRTWKQWTLTPTTKHKKDIWNILPLILALFRKQKFFCTPLSNFEQYFKYQKRKNTLYY